MNRVVGLLCREPDYAKLDHKFRAHHQRFVAFVTTNYQKLHCMDCGGAGGEVDVIDPWLGGPWIPCEWCEGTGLMTPHLRGLWLQTKNKQNETPLPRSARF